MGKKLDYLFPHSTYRHANGTKISKLIVWGARDRLMTLYTLTLNICLLVAALMLAVPAKAETWSCAYHDKSAKHPRPIAFTRDGGRFKNKTLAEFVIVHESDQAIHLYAQETEATASIVVLNKQRKTFIMTWTNSPIKGEPTVTKWVGGCIIL